MNSPSPPKNNDLAKTLRSLCLLRTAEDLPDFVARATRARWSPVQLLEELSRAELADRSRRSLERRLARSHLVERFQNDGPTACGSLNPLYEGQRLLQC